MNAPHPHRVMFVDDEEGVRASWNRFLGERGFDVTTAEDGLKARGLLEKEQDVEVVVADLRMPGLDGLQLLEWVQEERPDTPFILLTGYGNDEVERRARELGVFEYLNKPISPEALATVITAASQAHARKSRSVEATDVADAVAEVDAAAEMAEAVEIPVTETIAPEPRPKSRLRGALETAGALVAAPFLGLAFVAFLPLIGFVALFWFLGERVFKGKAVANS